MKKIKDRIAYHLACLSSKAFVNYCRDKGVIVGNNVQVPCPRTVSFDLSRPCLIEIGNNVRINKYMTIMTHDFASMVFVNKYAELVNSSGKIKIGNNVYFGHHCTVLKGVTIGDNCIIGFGSTVMRDIPANSVAAGTPAKVICTLDEYLEKRKTKALSEAFEYALAIRQRENRMPKPEDFREEFPYFVDASNMCDYPHLPYQIQLGPEIETWKKKHKRMFSSFEAFLDAAGVHKL